MGLEHPDSIVNKANQFGQRPLYIAAKNGNLCV